MNKRQQKKKIKKHFQKTCGFDSKNYKHYRKTMKNFKDNVRFNLELFKGKVLSPAEIEEMKEGLVELALRFDAQVAQIQEDMWRSFRIPKEYLGDLGKIIDVQIQ